ncbi:MAG: cytochrome b/b6 domain-containing protein [Pyrinomonadaceae bacterium]|nr:cytochrome b/b6 domain-containing protein [Pyrinomonadaceae bacterium]MBP6211561.1 cytochrome b/b6 domain-containing protein [Pyrinomonadaceae bacterium]
MKTYLKSAAIIAFLLIWATFYFYDSAATEAQNVQVQPNLTGNRQQTQFPSNVNLDCAGCHGPGKNLPYIAGEQFHKDTHSALSTSIHNKLAPNGKPIASCKDCHTINGDITTALPAENPKSTVNRAAIANTCSKCHSNKAVMQGSGISDRPILAYQESVHAQAFARGVNGAAVCTDCHNTHDIQPASSPGSSIAKINIAQTCGKCHGTESSQFVESVHGEAVTRGVSRSPSCTDCHGIHDIQKPLDQTKQNPAAAIATDSCAKCHEGVALTREFGVASGRVISYKDSYHGLASDMGSKVVANCASCHGVHNILPSSDPRSMISSGNLAQTCGQCHVGANENFINGKIHLTSSLASERPAEDMGLFGTTVVRWIYLPLIFLVIGGMVLHNVLIWRKKAAAKRREPRTIVRLSVNQRVQHWFLLTSFIALVFSGFALQYPDSWLGWLMGGSEAPRRIVHRVAAVVMMVMGTYHIFYLALTKEGRQWFVDMLPGFKDVTDLFGNFMYYLGVRAEKPKIARFGYAEKAEYWAVVWGTVIMGLTGLMLWFKIDLFGFLPRYWIEIALAVHYYEAILATLAIIVWHFYQVIFDPDVYPINFAFLDGRISEEAFKEEHEQAYEEMIEAEKAGAVEAASNENEKGPAE